MTTHQAIRTAEEAAISMHNRDIMQLTNQEEETSFFHYSTQQRYEQKHGFRVLEIDLNLWAISTESPTFYPQCDLIEYLLQECFTSVQIDDECNLLVAVPHPSNSQDDKDYIAECFDRALEWLPLWTKAMDAYSFYQQAKATWETSVKKLTPLKTRIKQLSTSDCLLW